MTYKINHGQEKIIELSNKAISVSIKPHIKCQIHATFDSYKTAKSGQALWHETTLADINSMINFQAIKIVSPEPITVEVIIDEQ